MRVDALVNATSAQGFILWRDGDKVKFRGNMEMPPEQINALRKQKLELLAYLKLREIAGERDWQLTDLLDWYKDDLADIAAMDLASVRQVVQHYIENLALCRGEGYQPPCDTPIEPNLVQCANCQNFIPDPIGYGGIGECDKDIKHNKQLYPNSMRICVTFKQEN